MQYFRDHKPDPERNHAFRTAVFITLAGNIILAISKGVVSYISGSIALYADTANSISDVIYSIAITWGLWMIQRPPDMSHPQGHARFEPLVGLVVSITMGIAGYEALRSSFNRFLAGGSVIALDLPSITLLASALIKAGMFYSITKLAQKTDSPSLKATAIDHLSDVLTSAAAFGGILGSNILHPLMDPIAGFIVSLWIFRAAFRAGKENFGFLTGAGADEKLRLKIIDTANNVDGVLNVRHMMSDYVGPKLLVDLRINLPGNASLDEVHAVEERVITPMEALPEVDRAYVHVEPFDE